MASDTNAHTNHSRGGKTTPSEQPDPGHPIIAPGYPSADPAGYPKARISAPFFLRPRSDALLSAVMVRSQLLAPAGCNQAALARLVQTLGNHEQRDGAAAGVECGGVRHILLACPMWSLDNNVGGVRDSWPWKVHNQYYHSMRYSA